MPTILISGAANGLGAAFVDAYCTQEHTKVIAIDRELCQYEQENVESVKVDITAQQDLKALGNRLSGTEIDLVIHSAGVRGLVPNLETTESGNIKACESLDAMNFDTMMRTFQINSVGTFMLVRVLLPSLKRSTQAKVIILSSRMGSIGNNVHPKKDAGGAYAYRASKAATNNIIRSLAADVPGVTFILCHPGRVETKLVKWREEGAITAQESVNGLLPLIERWSQKDSGRFYDRFGETIEW